MRYVAFQSFFPKLAEEETRFFRILNDPEIPPDTYYLEEAYCQDLNCDCRRVLFFVFSESDARMVAAVSYGWESGKFYAKMSSKPFSDLNNSKGPLLDESFPQSEFAPAILDILRTNVLNDKKYVKRLKRHYRMLRSGVAEKEFAKNASPALHEAKTGRNEPCPCGSGKKYKKCCMK